MAKFKNVLLIDDDPLTILICEKMMAITGFCDNVNATMNGTLGLNYLREKVDSDHENIPQIILLDLNMPPLNGWEFLDQFAQIAPSIETAPPIYILSSTVDPEDLKRAMSYASVKGFISKPLTKEQLDAIV